MTVEKLPPVDTMAEPHEPAVVIPSSALLWVHVLAGPTIWMVHFLAVYLVAEWSCQGVRTGWFDGLSPGGVELSTLIITVVAVALSVGFSLWSRRTYAADGGMFPHVGWILSLGTAAFVLLVGVPALWLEPCAF